MTSTGGSEEGDAEERREVHAFKLHVLNHEAPDSQAEKYQQQQAFKDTARARRRGGESPRVWVSAVQGSREEKQGN